MFRVPEQYRVRPGTMPRDRRHLETTEVSGNNGAFRIPLPLSTAPRGESARTVFVIASEGAGWEHVSVSFPDRCPTWEEMCVVKAHFWTPDDCVVQFHPPDLDHINVHPYCLHLWRPIFDRLPQPPKWMVG